MMNDVHMHIIPGVDDGAWNLDMSLTMIDMAYQQGIRKIVGTPHSDAFMEDPEQVKTAYQELKEAVRKRYPDLEIYMGCEVLCRKSNMDMVLGSLESGVFPSLNGTKYVLTEFTSLVNEEEAEFCVRKLLDQGWIPVIAHVERYEKLFWNENFISQLKELGCMLQINVYSVYEEENETIKKNAHKLLKKKQVDFLGTDAHRTIHRPPSAEQGLKFLYSYYEKEYMDSIAFGNAEKKLRMSDGYYAKNDYE